MSDILTVSFLTSVLAAAMWSGASILYAALGEVLAERAGVLNLGVEGMMLAGALGGFAVCYWTESAWVGLLGAIVCGGAMATIHAVLTVSFRANQVVSGLALTIFGGGLTAYCVDGVLHYEYNLFLVQRTIIASPDPVSAGEATIEIVTNYLEPRPGGPLTV